jgi:hypothetical protein
VQPAIDLASRDRLVYMFTFNFIILQNFSAYVVPFTLHAYFACMQNGGSVSLATILQSKIVALVMQRALQQITCLFIQIAEHSVKFGSGTLGFLVCPSVLSLSRLHHTASTLFHLRNHSLGTAMLSFGQFGSSHLSFKKLRLRYFFLSPKHRIDVAADSPP